MIVRAIAWFLDTLKRVFWVHRQDRYHAVQILMHWLIVVLVIEQYWTSRAVLRMNSGARLLGKEEPFDMVLHDTHLRIGLAMLALIILRLALRLWLGAPQWNPAIPAWRQNLALTVQFGLYGVLLGQAVSGAITSYLWWPMHLVHRGFFYLLLGFVALHLAGAAWSLLSAPLSTVRRITGWRLGKAQ
ncbi:MAG: cytochrome b/b6 domain-containing protein [Ancalomicrobiaceae bacterium]|nr:cytochrome b/b6 domain-containing protein [Ancalomicrobiaceae bacterium]